ncbi:MAG TPA: DUF4136 domain-containing protein [Vicinamibacterales bacterium]|nr:DUF4136 domain-containing protein [Vicinamibacterales bacterium]
MRRVLFAALIALLPVAILADDMSVSADPKARFDEFKTFAFRDRKIASDRPELDNRLFVKKLESAVRTGLRAKGVTEAGSNPDLFIDLILVGQDISTAMAPPARGVGPQPLRFTAGTLTIDMSRPGETEPVWRGVYRDDETTGSRLVEKLPQDAGKLIDKYPKRKAQ